MRCKSCDYPLWGITARACPECGGAFKPSDFRLVPNAVKFLCPHCKQDYYGTTATGHLDPPEFDCVTCGAHLHMDQMVLEPREGVKDERTRPDFNPWLQRKTLGTRKAYYRTIGRALGYPARLARGTPDDSPTSSALGFFAIHILFISLFTVVPLAAIMMAAVFSVGSAEHRGVGMFMLPVLLLLGLPTVGFFGVLFASALATQVGLAPLAGHTTHLRVTLKALAYASAPLLLMAVPCLGFQLAIFAVPWWMINAVVMLSAFHRIAWWRAAIAHVLGVVLIIGLPIAGIVLFVPFGSFLPSPGGSPQASAAMSVWAALRQVRTPGQNEHLIELFELEPMWSHSIDDVSLDTITPNENMIGPYTVAQFLALPDAVRGPMVVDLRTAVLPSGIHRLGHIVVCDVGVNLSNVQGPNLWIAIVWPDPDSGAAFIAPETVTVILASGMAQDIPLAQFPADLATQNAARTSLGIPEIPDPATVHMWPPGSQFGPSPTPVPVP